MYKTLLLTDIVDSTALTEQLGDEHMGRIWVEHDRIARGLLAAHEGREADRTDGFLILFDSPAPACAYAIRLHRALDRLSEEHGINFKARIGIHCGEIILIEHTEEQKAAGAKPIEVEGLTKPTAARVMSVALGGQTLLSNEAREALGQTPLRLESHGHWRMKGIAAPVEIFEIGDAEAPFIPPPDGAKVYRVVAQEDLWLPVKSVKHSLPAERDAFVGRHTDLVTLAGRLDSDARLISVLGIGGTGKTRLVTRYGWTWLGDYPGGVWFCDLSEARNVEGIAYAVARALDVPLGKEDPIVQLGHAIAGRGPCLMLLDNFEQVARHAAATLGKWLDRTREAQFVVTTREVLGLPGEEALALAPLPSGHSAALFVARARSAKRDFEPNDVASIDALVTLLDGLPLAIELAAARVRVMPPAKLLERMSQRFQLLTSSGGRHDRQATLRATLDWSWDLLTADEQQALGQLSVFEGGLTLEAAEAVLVLHEAWPMDAVQALVDKSLVRQTEDDRFDLLVSVQEYATEKRRVFDDPATAEDRHGAWFATFGTSEALDSLDVHGGVKRRVALGRELDNLVAACRRAVQRGDGEGALALLHAAWAVLKLRGPVLVGIALAEQVVGMPALATRERALALQVLGDAQERAGQKDEARAHLDAALAIHRALGDRGREGLVLGNLGSLHCDQGGMDEARAHLDAALAIHREVGNRRGEGTVLGSLGIVHLNQGRLDEARTHFDAVLAIAREVGNRRSEGNVLGNLAIVHANQGRLDEARAHLAAALAIHREVGHRRSEGIVLGNLGSVHKGQGRIDEACAHFDDALAIHREVGNRRGEGNVLSNLGGLHIDQGRMDEARANLDAALVIHREVGDRRDEGRVLGNLGFLDWSQGRMDEARAHFADGERLLREVDDPIQLGFLLCARARLEHHEGAAETARATLAEADALAMSVGAGPDSELSKELAQTRAMLGLP